MADVGSGHVTTDQNRIKVVWADRRVEHGSATPRPEDPEITRATRFTITIAIAEEEDEPQERAEKEKRHLFPLLSLLFVSLSFWQNLFALSIPFVCFLLERRPP